MTNNTTWFEEFDATKDKFQWIFLDNGFENDWKQLLEARKRRQIKRMRYIIQQIIWDLPKPLEYLIGWDSLESLLLED